MNLKDELLKLYWRRKVYQHTVQKHITYQGQGSMVGFRIGMWVRIGNRTGIIVEFTPDNRIKSHLVNDSGATILTTNRETGWVGPMAIVNAPHEIRQAKLDEIPESRRPSLKVGLRFGYVGSKWKGA